jgi:hypothetical protein
VPAPSAAPVLTAKPTIATGGSSGGVGSSSSGPLASSAFSALSGRRADVSRTLHQDDYSDEDGDDVYGSDGFQSDSGGACAALRWPVPCRAAGGGDALCG